MITLYCYVSGRILIIVSKPFLHTHSQTHTHSLSLAHTHHLPLSLAYTHRHAQVYYKMTLEKKADT